MNPPDLFAALYVLYEQAYNQPHRNYSGRVTVCVSRVYQPHTSWMLTAGGCEPRHGWTPEFSFYASFVRQEHSR